MELFAQAERAVSLGVRPTHIDGHQHVHVLPRVFSAALAVAKKHGVPAMRLPAGSFFLEYFSKRRKETLRAAGMKYPDFFFGLAETGTLDAASLASIIRALPEGTSELMCHPGTRDDLLAEASGWGMGWEADLSAVTDEGIRKLAESEGIELISYRDMEAV